MFTKLTTINSTPLRSVTVSQNNLKKYKLKFVWMYNSKTLIYCIKTSKIKFTK